MGTAFLYGNGGGSNLNFSVKAYETESAMLADTPKENTVGVVTGTAVPDWSFSASEPAELSDGTVWVQTGTESAAEFDALKKNTLVVYLSGCKQYISGAWELRIAYLYKNGEWVQFSSLWDGTLYPDSDLSLKYTGGWTGALKQSTGGSSAISTRTVNAIDLSDWNTLSFTGKISSTYQHIFGITETTSNSSYAAKSTSGSDGSIDVSSFTGSYYVWFYSKSNTGASFDITEVKLS